VKPDFAFFGQKDAQQAALIKKMVRELAFGAEIVVLPIVREESGLALSSRNAYLTPDERQAATVLYRALTCAAKAYDDGERSAASLIEMVRSTIDNEPLARIDYVAVSDADTLDKLDNVEDGPALLSLAVYIGKTRLIDNVIFGAAQKQDAAGARA
jgi:pantoate--beta-alanine ligase